MEECLDKKPAASRKRNRPEWSQKQETAKEEDDSGLEQVCLQTPHTLRLLKLIEEGTLEHARIAASHLASLSASPIVLWDLLGRLQAFLCSPQWSTRLHASLAMQGVAQHIPPTDQREFLEAVYNGPLWLTVEEVSQGFETILTEGRVLLAECDTKEDPFATQEDRLKRLDERREELQEDFVERRVRLQREILAQRLGLGGVVQAVGGTVLSDVITKEDLLMNDDTGDSKAKPQKRMKQQRRDGDEEYSGSIRALLVMEMQQQQEQSNERGATSHKNPQTLLATELIYRMFDPSWHIRHGAFLGTLSLLRAWKGVVGQQHSFGMWPHDIMARCLCVLSLDRFGDYGGAGLGEDGDGGGDSVVAPVREMAGQLLSVLLAMAPESVQWQCLQVLYRMSSREEWEVRHGSLLAIKYIVAILSSNVMNQSAGADLVATVQDISRVAQERLSDNMEDVQSVAAQVLLSILSGTQEREDQCKELIQASVVPLWGALGRLRSISSCAVDFVGLFSAMVCADCSLVCTALTSSLGKGACVLGVIADKLVGFLDYDSTAVNLSALKAIGSIAHPFTEMVTDSDMHDASEVLVHSYCSLLERIFLSFLVGRYAAAPHEDDKESQSRYESFCSVRDATWIRLTGCARTVLRASSAHRSKFFVRLMVCYMKIRHHAAGQIADVLNSRSADALSRLLRQLDDGGVVDSFLEIALCLLLNSPWTEHCESACHLYQALNSHEHPLLRRTHDLLNQLLLGVPSCVTPGLSSDALLKPVAIESAECALQSILTSVVADRDNGSSLELGRLWQTALHSQGFEISTHEKESGPALVNTSSMRIYSLIAGAVVSGGQENLPSRLTPLVRALMTSLKSERNRERQALTCESLALLLKTLSNCDDESRLRVRTKVVENVCAMLSSACASPEIRGAESTSSEGAAQVIVLLISQLPPNKTLASIPPIWNRLSLLAEVHTSAVEDGSLVECFCLLSVTCKSLKRGTAVTRHVIKKTMRPLVPIACTYRSSDLRTAALDIIVSLCRIDPEMALDTSLPLILKFLADKDNDPRRLGSLRLLKSIIEGVGIDICPFVRCLLPVTMSLMTDSLEDCAKEAAQSFAALVRVSPLVKQTKRRHWEIKTSNDESEKVIDHLIHGKPLPPCVLPDPIVKELSVAGISLRDYQMEGITWLVFLQKVKLNGILAGTSSFCSS